MTIRVLVVALAATASLVACGGEDPRPASGSGPDADSRKAMLDFARCMRENGVDMPDPQFDGGRVTMRQDGKTNPETARAAEKACAKYRDAVKPPEMSDEQKEEFKKRALENARCMREHGIDMPDPQFDENGGAQMRLGRGIDPESAKFKKAQEACRGTLPDGPSTTSAGGGEER
jgi:hypothetical protein